MVSLDETTTTRPTPLNFAAGAAAGVLAAIPLGIIMQLRYADPDMMPGVVFGPLLVVFYLVVRPMLSKK